MAKYNQKKETKYFNNEFENMPSIDFRCLYNNECLDTQTKKEIEWDVIDEICKKHGFSYTLINSTFGLNSKGNFDVTCLIYKKIDLSHEQYAEWIKFNEWGKIHEEQRKYTETYKKLHECIHELDEETELVFDTAYAGNYGLFGSNDVRRKTYSPIDFITDWNTIVDRFSPLIHDTEKKLTKGVYIMTTTSHLKRIVKTL